MNISASESSHLPQAEVLTAGWQTHCIQNQEVKANLSGQLSIPGKAGKSVSDNGWQPYAALVAGCCFSS